MSSVSSEGNWFYEMDGQKNGPVTEGKIGEFIRAGTVSAKSHVWKQGFADWKKVEETELNVYIDKSIPPRLKVNDIAAWLLALWPLYMGFIYAFMVGFYQGFVGYRVTARGFAVVTIIYGVAGLFLSVLLFMSDEKRLKKAGYQEKISRWTWLFGPIYLYKRAKLLNQNFLFLFVYLGCLVVSCFLY